MRRFALRFFLILFFVALICAAVAQDKPAPQRKIDLPIGEWLKEGEHQDIPWHVHITRPALTFQQRSIVTVFAEVHSDVLQRKSTTRDLHFIVKVAGADGKWADDESYVPYHVDAKLDRKADIQLETELYLQPGEFTVATIAYDSVLGERNLSFTKVHVDEIARDPLPQLLTQAPPIQFLPSPAEGLVPFGETRINLPVATQRPVQFDLLVDLSAYDQSDSMNQPMPPPRRNPRRGLPGMDVQLPRKKQTDIKYLDRLIQTASVLSQLRFENGCTRVTAVDMLRRKTILPTTSEAIEWKRIRQVVLGPDRNLVSVNDLSGKREAPDFLAQQLARVMAPEPRCSSSPVGKPVHVVAVLAHPVQLPFDHSKTKAQKSCDCDFFYLKQVDSQSSSDDLKGVLSPLSPKSFEFRDPLEFRRKLADLVNGVQKVAQ